MQGFLQRGHLVVGQPPLRFTWPQQDVLDGTRRGSGQREADGWADADDAVNAPVGFLDRGEGRGIAARKRGKCCASILDLAVESGDEARTHAGEALGEWIYGHDAGSLNWAFEQNV